MKKKIQKKKNKRKTNKYIQKTNRGYIIFRRNDNKELISYGTYKTLDEAIKIRDYLIKTRSNSND